MIIAMPKQRSKAESRRNNSGQFLILSAISIVIVMVSLASLLSYASVSRIHLERTDFRKVTTEVTFNFRSALAAALADVSKALDHKASISRYANYTGLDDYPDAKLRGYAFMTTWQKTTLTSYPGLGLNFSVSQPSFQCEWDSYLGYSTVSSNMSLDILAYDFKGWKSSASVQLNLTILSLDANKTDGETVAFYFQIQKENGAPISDVSKDMTFLMFQHTENGEFTLSKNFNLTYLGGGTYLAKFSMYSTDILEGLNAIRDYIRLNMTQNDFKPEYQATAQDELSNMVNQTIAKYDAGLFVEAYGVLTGDTRPKLVPKGSGSWVVDTANTSYVLGWIDIVSSQLLPTVRIALQDSRGIVVGAIRMLSNIEKDNTGPTTRYVDVSPNPTRGSASVTLTASIDDLSTGFSNVIAAEYFIDSIGENGTGISMVASDGKFDSISEEAKAVIDVSSWLLGVHTIYVHGKDEYGLWGAFNSAELNVTEVSVMYVQSIDMYLRSRRDLWRVYWFAESVVTIVDANGIPVEGATVYGHWSGSVRGNVDGITDEDGRVSFSSQRRGGRPVFTFTVDNIVKSGYVYKPNLNKETSDTIRV